MCLANWLWMFQTWLFRQPTWLTATRPTVSWKRPRHLLHTISKAHSCTQVFRNWLWHLLLMVSHCTAVWLAHVPHSSCLATTWSQPYAFRLWWNFLWNSSGRTTHSVWAKMVQPTNQWNRKHKSVCWKNWRITAAATVCSYFVLPTQPRLPWLGRWQWRTPTPLLPSSSLAKMWPTFLPKKAKVMKLATKLPFRLSGVATSWRLTKTQMWFSWQTALRFRP